MAFINAKKRKLAEDTSSNKFSKKSHKRHHSNHVAVPSIDNQAAMKDTSVPTAAEDIRKETMEHNVPEDSNKDAPSKASKNLKNPAGSKAESTDPNQSAIAHTPDPSGDMAPSLRPKNNKNDSYKDTAKQRQHSSETLEFPANQYLPTNEVLPANDALSPTVEMAKAKSANKSGASPIKKIAKQRRASTKVSSPPVDQAASIESTKTGPSRKIAQKKVSSSDLSSLDEGDVPSIEGTDADADAASTSPSEETPGEKDELGEEDDKDSKSDSEDDKVDETDEDDKFPSSSSDELPSKEVFAKHSSSNNEGRDNQILVDPDMVESLWGGKDDPRDEHITYDLQTVHRLKAERLEEYRASEFYSGDESDSEDESDAEDEYDSDDEASIDKPWWASDSESTDALEEREAREAQEIRTNRFVDTVEQTIAENDVKELSDQPTPDSEGSLEWASDAVHLNRYGEEHPDNKKKEIFKVDDPSVFATSMSNILGLRLTRTQRTNPILARSKDARAADDGILDRKLEKTLTRKWKNETVEIEGGWLKAAEAALEFERVRLEEIEIQKEKEIEEKRLRDVERARRLEEGLEPLPDTEDESSEEELDEDGNVIPKEEEEIPEYVDPIPGSNVHDLAHGKGSGGPFGSAWDSDEDFIEKHKYYKYQLREKKMRKTAEKGVIKMFNAFTTAHEKTVELQGLVGSKAKKEEKATEMSKEGWLDYIVGLGGKPKREEKGTGKIEEEVGLSQTEKKGEQENGKGKIEEENGLPQTAEEGKTGENSKQEQGKGEIDQEPSLPQTEDEEDFEDFFVTSQEEEGEEEVEQEEQSDSEEDFEL